MRSMLRSVLSSALLLSAAVSFAGDLVPGSKAPALDVKTWYKGTPVKAFQPNKVYVVEFWATWCGPCRDSIPHLTELAKKNKDVTFVGVSIWEDDKGGNIKKFVTGMGAKMNYNVGYSGNHTGMSKTWMEASKQNGIPTAFIVKNKQVLWIGHPMEMASPLTQIKTGKFNLDKFKKEYQGQLKAMQAQRDAGAAIAKKQLEIKKLIADRKYSEADTALDSLEKLDERGRYEAAALRFEMLAKTNPEKWEIRAKELAGSDRQDDHSILIAYALTQVGEHGDLPRAQHAVEILTAALKENDVIGYFDCSQFYDMTKDPKMALKMIDKAIEAFPKSTFKDSSSLKEGLATTRKEFAKKAGA